MLIQNMDVLGRRAGTAEHLVHRKHRIVARVIGIVAGRPVDRLASSLEGEVVGDRDRFVVGDEEAKLRLRSWCPRSYARISAWLKEIDRSAAAAFVSAGV